MPRVPIYSPSQSLTGLPSVRQNARTTEADFINPVGAAALETVGRGLEGAQAIALQSMQEQQRLQEQAAREADQFRVQDALNKLQQYSQDAQYGDNGWSRKQGAEVFDTPDKRPLSVSVVEGFNRQRDELSLGLGNDRQRAMFAQHANDAGLRLRGQLMGFEADQYRVYQRGVLGAGIESEAKNIGLNYNDFDAVQQSLEKIDHFGAQLGRIEGEGEDLGRIKAQGFASNALKSAIGAALQHGRTNDALAILNQFGDRFDANDKTNVQNAISESWAAAQIQANPQGFIQEMTGAGIPRGRYSDDPLTNAIIHQESGGRDFGKDGGPLMSFDGKSRFKMQVTDETARDPGFGIRPASSETPEEYNRVGRELISALKQKYDGDPAKVAAAYNAGSGAVDKAIAKGGLNWQDYIPKETQETYIPAVLKNLGGKISPNSNNPYIGMMNQQDRRKWLNAAESEAARGQAIFAANLKKTVTDQYAEAQATGTVINRIPEGQFYQAFGPEQGGAAYADYQDQLQFGQQKYSLRSMSLSQLNDALTAAKPQPGSPDFAREQEQYERMAGAAQAIQQERAKDPMLFAQQSGYDVKPIQWGNAAQVQQELANRGAIAKTLTEKYGVSYSPLTEGEATALTEVLNGGTEDEKITVLKSLASGLNDQGSFSAVVQKIRPDSPATVVAAGLIGVDRLQHTKSWFSDKATLVRGEDVARTIIKGDRLLNPSKGQKDSDGKSTGVSMPTKFNEEIYSQLGGALEGDADLEANIVSAARAYYAAKMDKSKAEGNIVDSQLLTEAINNVTGGIADHADKKVLVPFGMPPDVFEDQAHELFKTQMEAAGMGHLAALWDSLPLVLVGENRYAVQRGSGTMAVNGKPVILDFNQ